MNEDVIRLISAKKNEPDFLLKFRLRAYKQWLKMKEPDWSGLTYSKVDYQDLGLNLFQSRLSGSSLLCSPKTRSKEEELR